MNIRRGLIAGGLCAIVGAAIPASVVLAYTLFRWLKPSFMPSDSFRYFLDDLVEFWPFPVCGGAVYFGCAAWATYAPAGSWRFVTSLSIIFVVAVACWFFVGFLDNWLHLGWLKIYKGDDPHSLRLSQALVLFGPPFAIAQLLALVRQWRSNRTLIQPMPAADV